MNFKPENIIQGAFRAYQNKAINLKILNEVVEENGYKLIKMKKGLLAEPKLILEKKEKKHDS